MEDDLINWILYCIRYVMNYVPLTFFTGELLNVCVFIFSVTVENLQVWSKSVRTHFGKLTGNRSEDGVRKLLTKTCKYWRSCNVLSDTLSVC